MGNLQKNTKTSSTHISDGDFKLAQAAAHGDHRARSQIVNRMYDLVRTTVSFLAAGHRDQEDWVQIILVKILHSLGTFRGKGSLESWGNRIAIRWTLHFIKTRRRYDKIVTLDPTPDKLRQSVEADERYFMRQRLAAALDSLSFKYRTVLVLRLVHGYSSNEIADLVDAPLNTVRQRLRRGRAKLAGKLSKDIVFEEWRSSIKS